MRSIIDIEVRDEKFKEFIRQFDAYQDMLKSQGGLWTKQGTAIKGANAQLKSLASMADDLAKGVGDANKNQEKFRKSTDQSSRSMSNLARSTRDVAKGILGATTMLLKWSGITTAIGGLLGAGGLFGMSRLAGNISGQQKFATGTGVSYGAGQAFGPAFNRFLDSPDALLSKMAEYKSSSKGMGEFIKMGITGAENKSADELAIEAMRKARDFYKKTPKGLLQDYSQAYGFSDVFSTEEMRRLGKGGLESRIGVFSGSKRSLNMAGGETGPYQNLKDQLSLSGAGIEADFGRALSGLTPQLMKLSEAIRVATGSFLKSDLVKGALSSLSDGIKNFSDYLKSPEFMNDMDEFLETMKKLAAGMKTVLGMIPGVDMRPSNGLQLRSAERTFGLKSGTMSRIAAAATPAGFGMSDQFANSASMIASIAANPSRMSSATIRKILRDAIGKGIDDTDPSTARKGTAVYNDLVRRRSAVEAATNRAMIELKVVNDSGGNAAVSVNGMVAQ